MINNNVNYLIVTIIIVIIIFIFLKTIIGPEYLPILIGFYPFRGKILP